MRNLLMLLVLGLLLVACDANGLPVTSNPASGVSAASQQRSADNALQQAQQQQDVASASAIRETEQAQAADNARALAAAATAQVMDAARAQLTADAQVMLADQQQAQATAMVQVQLTQQVVQANEAKATLDARAVLLAQQNIQATATEQAQAAQQAAQSIEAKATVDARGVLLVQQQAQATATAEAMQREGVTAKLADSNSRVQSDTMLFLIPLGAVIVFGLVLVLGVKYVSGLIDRANEKRRLENHKLALITAMFKPHDETVVFVDVPAALPLLNSPADEAAADKVAADEAAADEVTAGKAAAGEAYDPGEAFASLDAEPPALVILSNNDPRLPDRAEDREEAARCKLVMRLLRDAIGHTQAHSNHIPSAIQLGWPTRAWAVAVAILRPYGVETLQGGQSQSGTYLLGQYSTLQALYIAIGERRLNLYPPVTEGALSG